MSGAERGDHTGERGRRGELLCAPPASWLKRWLWHYQNLRVLKEECEAGPPPSARRWIIMGSVIMLALIFMVLLLFWNYQCTLVDKLCQGKEESSMFPLFGDWDENLVKEKQV